MICNLKTNWFARKRLTWLKFSTRNNKMTQNTSWQKSSRFLKCNQIYSPFGKKVRVFFALGSAGYTFSIGSGCSRDVVLTAWRNRGTNLLGGKTSSVRDWANDLKNCIPVAWLCDIPLRKESVVDYTASWHFWATGWDITMLFKVTCIITIDSILRQLPLKHHLPVNLPIKQLSTVQLDLGDNPRA